MKDVYTKSYLINRLAILSEDNAKLEKIIDLLANLQGDCVHPDKNEALPYCTSQMDCAECRKQWAMDCVLCDEKNE